MAVNREELLETISKMSVMEVVELVEAMEEKFNVSAASMAPGVMPMVGAGAAGEQEPEKTEFDAVLKEYGSNKVAVIKAVRAITGLGLKEAKETVEGAPSTIKEAVSKEDADDVKKQLEEAGAKVDVV